MSKIKLTTIIGVTAVALSACGSGSSGTPVEKDNRQTNSGKTYPHWVPYRTEYYGAEGELTSCIRGDIDSEGYLLSTMSSNPPTDAEQPLLCSDSDQNTNFSEYTFNNDRSEFETNSLSTYDPNTSCQKVTLSSKNMPSRIETFTSGTGNYSCSVQDGSLFSVQETTLENELYDTLTILYAGAGLDNEWGTDDDVIQARYDSTWTSDKLIKQTVNRLGAGTDSIWGTSDDYISSVVDMVFKEDMIPDYSITTYLGLDGVIDTDDDLITTYTVFTYENGAIKNHTAYGSPGIDGNWETTSDNYKLYTVFY